jgi:hypothetical protein
MAVERPHMRMRRFVLTGASVAVSFFHKQAKGRKPVLNRLEAHDRVILANTADLQNRGGEDISPREWPASNPLN